MNFNLDKEEGEIWGGEYNSEFYTNKLMECDVCGSKTKYVSEYCDPEFKESIKACFNTECMPLAVKTLFNQNPEIDFFYSRSIIYKSRTKPEKKMNVSEEIKNKNIKNDDEPKYTLRQLRGAWYAGKKSTEGE